MTSPVASTTVVQRAAVAIGLTVCALAVALVVASNVGLGDSVLIAVALVLLVGAHLMKWYARRALFRQIAPDGRDARPRRSG